MKGSPKKQPRILTAASVKQGDDGNANSPYRTNAVSHAQLEGRVEKTKAKVKADVAKAEAEAVVMQKKLR